PLAPASLTASAPSPLFPRLDDKLQQALLDKILPPDVAAPASPPASALPGAPAGPTSAPAKPASAAAAPAAPPGPITIDDFGKIELRVGKVLSASAVP